MPEEEAKEQSHVRLHILAARGLSLVQGIAARNPIYITRWNMRECARAEPVRNDVNPEWEEAGIPLSSSRTKLLHECILDVEVWDWNFKTAKTMDFLGTARFSGKALMALFDEGSKKQYVEVPLQKSKRLNVKQNEHVQGTLVLFGVRGEDMERIPENKVPQGYRMDEKKKSRRKRQEKPRRKSEKKKPRECPALVVAALLASSAIPRRKGMCILSSTRRKERYTYMDLRTAQIPSTLLMCHFKVVPLVQVAERVASLARLMIWWVLRPRTMIFCPRFLPCEGSRRHIFAL